jgi:hypothetical protein
MKQPRKANQTQTELFREPSVPIPVDLGADRETELKRLIAALLLKLSLDNAGVPRGGEYDE